MHDFIPYSPQMIAERLFAEERRLLLFGESGIGKSTLAAELARALDKAGRTCVCIGADPGSPSFGAPGAVCLGMWQENGWQLLALDALCTLDAARFRLPLISAVRRLGRRIEKGIILVDAPGVVRGVAGAELLSGLVEAAEVDTLLILARDRDDKILPLANELETLPCEIFPVQASPEAHLPKQKSRARRRTRLWDSYLRNADEMTITLSGALLTGTPPPLDAGQDWLGRQIAFLKREQTLAIGEILSSNKNIFKVRIVDVGEKPDQILVRNAYRNQQGLLGTYKPASALALRYIPPPDVVTCPGTGEITGPRPIVRVGDATVTLVNGVFGDPLLHVRLHNKKRSILFDLGEGNRLPARLAHQVTDVFISHAHIDHISGFLWLMRSRIGKFPACRVFGLPGISDRIAGLISGIHWDRIGELGPQFEVGEIHGDQIIMYALQAGKESKTQLFERAAPGGILLDGPDFKVRAVTLTHGAIPVLAFCFEQAPKLNVRKNRLIDLKLEPGEWLGELKRRIAAGSRNAIIRLPGGRTGTAESLADALLLITPARKLVYATDFADNGTNREKMAILARGAHTFFCEAAFLDADRRYAGLSGHLTARACGEIANVAGVGQLVPFHFSRRYEKNPFQIYDEIKSYCSRIIFPKQADFIHD